MRVEGHKSKVERVPYSLQSLTSKIIASSASPALLALDLALAMTSGSRSDQMIVCGLSICFAFASAFTSSKSVDL